MKNRIIKILANQLGFDPSEIKPESLLKADLYADELDDVEIVIELEEEFNIEIPDAGSDKWNTVQDILDYMEGK